MDVVLQVFIVLLYLFMVVLIVRVVIDLVQVFARDYRPAGLALVSFEVVYTVTDPPIRALRKVIPPIRFGGVALDLAVLVLFIGIQVLLILVQTLRVG